MKALQHRIDKLRADVDQRLQRSADDSGAAQVLPVIELFARMFAEHKAQSAPRWLALARDLNAYVADGVMIDAIEIPCVTLVLCFSNWRYYGEPDPKTDETLADLCRGLGVP